MKNILLLLLAVLFCFVSGCDEPVICDCSDDISEFLEQVEEVTNLVPPTNSSSCANCGANCMLQYQICYDNCQGDQWYTDIDAITVCEHDCSVNYPVCLDGCG
jgi:hypothetical protein